MRDAEIADWLAASDWSDWKRTVLAGDASARRYERLSKQGETAILMNAPPLQCGSQKPFVAIAEHLRSLGLAAPHILAFDEALGLMILSDLGTSDVAQHLRIRPQDEALIYEAATDVLAHLSASPAPTGLMIMTPQVGADMLDPAFDWACVDQSTDLKSDIKAQMADVLMQVSPDPKTLSLRDFHAENLIWRADKSHPDRIGLLDFQDAFVTHPAYDLASLIRDARRDVSPDLLPRLVARLAKDVDEDTMTAAFHTMAVQRNLRILGIFHKLAKQQGKPRYLDLLPRVKHHLWTDLQVNHLADLRPLARRAFGLNDG
ncbi:aminoglycoside phosphotransferase family protein [Pseudooctadecabacter jejudonensis]|uniref:Phosphotransferase enzyme family protein n=1 Tax=Pseudooctadecabacter jejudonensis TaxID=1391910 RepID=A0A1Y5S7H8_9RHOB|nr:phosphotransferase [Pseudooctadecabacter jejudonensis]SLN33294.1 Phosphotransferase enzyme family protein [Pseudooctadecabacter jejudonensis]